MAIKVYKSQFNLSEPSQTAAQRHPNDSPTPATIEAQTHRGAGMGGYQEFLDAVYSVNSVSATHAVQLTEENRTQMLIIEV